MSSLNKVQIIGHLGKDVEIRYTQSSKAVANVSIATSESWKDKQTGEKQEKTEWHNVVAFDKLAEIMGEYLHKGSKVYLEGKLRTESYEKDGQTRYSTKVYAEQMIMLDGKPLGEARPAKAAAPRSAPVPATTGETFDDDNLPF